MTTFILPGFSASNKEWSLEVAKNLKVEGGVRPVFWDHWEDPKRTLKPKEKAEDIVDILLEDRINIIAKSVGTLVASYVIQEIPERVNKVILCGIPSISEKRLEIFQKSFKNFPPDNILVFQNEHDPLVSFSEVNKFMGKINSKINIVRKPRSDHHYPYFEDFQKFFM